ncbi:MAG: hypothetical protein J6X58_05905 [Bacteroidales bacterium]|nr:hypothetical protein [Bacteroidales bacterium]
MSDFGNKYEIKNTFNFFGRHWKLLSIVLVVSLVVSIAASLLVTKRYKSSVILFPTNSNRLSKAILADRYSLDYMDYGIERDCEYAIQILSSQSMEDDVCRRFKMMEHYGISADDPQKMFKLHENYRGNISVRRTEFLGVEVSVLDVDPQWAADIANYIAANYDTLCSRIQQDRSRDAYSIMTDVCMELENDIRALNDTLNKSRNRFDVEQLISNKTKELAELQTRMSQTKVDMARQVSYKFWLDQATPADKKAYPKRAVIVLLGTLGALALCILVLLVADRAMAEKKDDESAIG